jgi:predicted xylose isomerase-like sugar epimerase
MASDWPKSTVSGGISPIDCTRELTEFVAALDIKGVTAPLAFQECTLQAKPRKKFNQNDIV